MKDPFRPRSQPARAIYDAFHEEASKRDGRSPAVWMQKERDAVLAAATVYADRHGLPRPTPEDVRGASILARGHVAYGAKWAYALVDKMKQVRTEQGGNFTGDKSPGATVGVPASSVEPPPSITAGR